MANQHPGVLIISDRWGLPFEGGAPAAVRLLAHIFNQLGLKVFCAVLKMKVEEYTEAKGNNVELIPPEPRTRALRRKTPQLDWFHTFEAYFPKLFELENVEIGVGFSFITSDAACLIMEKVVPLAKYYLANVWPPDVPLAVVGCKRDELEEKLDGLEDECQSASAMVSFDEKTFNDFDRRFGDIKIDHSQLSLLPNDRLLKSDQPLLQAGNPTRQVLSFLEEYDFKEMKVHHKLGKAMNEIAEIYHTILTEPPRWRILTIPEAKEAHYRKKLKPHKHLKIVPSSMPTVKYMEREIRCSHLVLLPPSPGLNSYHLMLSVIAIGIPLLVAKYSSCHHMIRNYFPDHEYWCVVDMEDTDEFKSSIMSILQKPEIYFKRALEMKEDLRIRVLPSMKELNEKFIDKVKQDLYGTQPCTAAGKSSDQDGAEDSSTRNEVTQCVSTSSTLATTEEAETGVTEGVETPDGATSYEFKRLPGEINLHVNAAGGNPKPGHSITNVEDAYFNSDEVLVQTPQHIDNLHPGLKVKSAIGHSVRYSIACETLDALECLWKEYETLNLNRLISSVTITEKSLDNIGASFFSIQTTMDIEEYEQCQQELQEKGGVSMPTPAEVEGGDEARNVREVELQKENNDLRLECCKLKTTVGSLENEVVEYGAKIKDLNTSLDEGQLNAAIMQATLSDKDNEIATLKKIIEKYENTEKSFSDKMIQLRQEITQLKEGRGIGGDTFLADENHQLKEEVATLRKLVESLEERNATSLKELARLEDRVKGQWTKTKSIKFDSVVGVTTNPLGQVVLASPGTNSVLTLNSNFEVESEKRCDGQFAKEFKPCDVAVSTTNKHYITDSSNNLVLVWDKASQTTQTFCENDDIEPRSIALLDEDFVVTDEKHHKLVKYDQFGKRQVEVKGQVKSNQLNDPQCVTVNSDNNVIVSDMVRVGVGAIRVFNSQLLFLFTLCSGLYSPWGLSVDLWDNVYSIQTSRASYRRLIVKYTPNGEYVEEFGEGDINSAWYITVSKKNPCIVVSHPYDNLITVYTK